MWSRECIKIQELLSHLKKYQPIFKFVGTYHGILEEILSDIEKNKEMDFVMNILCALKE